jgi:hypothetical protein
VSGSGSSLWSKIKPWLLAAALVVLSIVTLGGAALHFRRQRDRAREDAAQQRDRATEAERVHAIDVAAERAKGLAAAERAAIVAAAERDKRLAAEKAAREIAAVSDHLSTGDREALARELARRIAEGRIDG